MAENLSKLQVEQTPVLIRPDILCIAKDEVYAVEIDGSVHKGDARRDRKYRDLCINVIVLNKEDLLYLEKSWEDFLREQLAERGYIPS